MLAPTQINFFDEPKLASLAKLNLLGKYLVPWSRKLGAGWQQIWVVDGFAGAGAYDSEGGPVDGSPRVAARWAARELETRGYALVKCVNVERERVWFDQLEDNTEQWRPHLVTNVHGEFATRLPQVLDIIKRDPTFFFLDPFGVRGIEMALLEQIIARGKRRSELLIHFSEKSFRRMAGHAQEHGRSAIGRKVAASKLDRLDRLMGTPLWRPRWEGDINTDDAMDATVELYLSQLQTRGVLYAYQIRMRNRYPDRSPYRLIFCTDSDHGVDVMSDRVARYEAELLAEWKPGQFDFFTANERAAAAARLADRIHEVGLRNGRFSQGEVRRALAPELFGEFNATEYAKAIRQLVKEGRINRRDAVGIRDDEPLRFVEPAQQCLMDAI